MHLRTAAPVLAGLAILAGCATDAAEDPSATSAIKNGTPAKEIRGAAFVDAYKDASLVARCSGIALDDRTVLTAAHCTDGATRFEVKLPYANASGSTTKAVVYPDWRAVAPGTFPTNRHDVAYLALDDAPLAIAAEAYGKLAAKPVKDGSALVEVGRVQNGAYSATDLFKSTARPGVSATRRGYPFALSLKGQVGEQGDAGGPVLTAAGEIVGVIGGTGGVTGLEYVSKLDAPALAWLKAQVARPRASTPSAPPATPPAPPSADKADSLGCYPGRGFTRYTTVDVPGKPLCCDDKAVDQGRIVSRCCAPNDLACAKRGGDLLPAEDPTSCPATLGRYTNLPGAGPQCCEVAGDRCCDRGDKACYARGGDLPRADKCPSNLGRYTHLAGQSERCCEVAGDRCCDQGDKACYARGGDSPRSNGPTPTGCPAALPRYTNLDGSSPQCCQLAADRCCDLAQGKVDDACVKRGGDLPEATTVPVIEDDTCPSGLRNDVTGECIPVPAESVKPGGKGGKPEAPKGGPAAGTCPDGQFMEDDGACLCLSPMGHTPPCSPKKSLPPPALVCPSGWVEAEPGECCRESDDYDCCTLGADCP